MTFSESVRTCLIKKYATFSGRASRSEYWWFQLFYFLVMIGLVLIFAAAGGLSSIDPATGQFNGFGGATIVAMVLMVVAILGMILPLISAVVRRLHDRNMSGWWYLAAIVVGMVPFVGFLASIALLVITVLKGTEGPNNYGPDPLGVGDADIFN